jgi:hypothetical protein
MSIVQGILKGFIGNWGMQAIDFYYEHSLWINGVILLYALVLYIAWRNYRKINEYLLQTITDQLEQKVKTWSKTEITRNLKTIEIPWEDARKKITIPLLAKSGSFLLNIASIKTIEKLFSRDVLINLLKEKNKK